MKKEYTCISCPLGCQLELNVESDNILVKGNKCKRGEIYAKEEYFSPKRTITTTCIAINSNNIHRIPVKTDKPLLKEYTIDLLKEIYSLKINLPVKLGDILIKNFKNTDVNVVVTRSVR
ncbi:MAG: hypothetical protein A2086_15890 [Spirochaetes bacterium GWD1_27_9]|nr:MAG: hypothetical protein A2Z98_11160 [Spirochaetes bacterium GWB1_27_13]OHD24815.1 MAG: hypothetical protein A2Y34_08270 [Spirochaetes bacterium GWC1_27_15]OHD42860.1 MAG: hypothetical protein A2086_15890 [Spirochaetes bacterium GWD1_27_9]